MIVLIRSVLLYLLLIFCLRLMGKRQIGELQPAELVVTILISDIASIPIADTAIPMTAGIVPVIVLSGFELIFSSISLKSPKFRRLMSGSPVAVIRNGQISQPAMKKLRLSVDDLMEALRVKSVFDISQVQLAVVETTGEITVSLKNRFQPATAQMVQASVPEEDPPAVLISDGNISAEALRSRGMSREKLLQILKAHALAPGDVFLLTADSAGICTIIPKTKN